MQDALVQTNTAKCRDTGGVERAYSGGGPILREPGFGGGADLGSLDLQQDERRIYLTVLPDRRSSLGALRVGVMT